MDRGDRMFCHACGGVWSKDDQDDLACPHCQSEFTEIVEIPPESPPTAHDPEPQTPPINPWMDHNPWGRDETSPPSRFGFADPGSPGYSQRTHRSPDGRFTFSSTTISGGSSPRDGGVAHPNPMIPMMLQSLESIFRGLEEIHNPQGPRGAATDPFHPHSPGWPEPEHRGLNESAGHERLPPQMNSLAEYVASSEDRDTVTDQLPSLLEAVRTGPQRPRRHGAYGVAAPDPFSMLTAVLLNRDRNGDAVYSQEELDRAISQLIDENNSGSGPTPASTTAIQSLPKKRVDQEMLGSDGKAECSICMDAVKVGTEVTVLPCSHWFHFSCIEAWLSQNNSCPHCRRSINATGE
ncbi:hypothetical protein N7512_000046 [Penicillium capsulatum]|nr:hypothetical protein N7512_000046 [Penicillium capsulatum]